MPARRAFTMVELLVTMAVITVLIALLIPAVQMARESARRTQCRSNLRQIGIAIANYESQYAMWPPGMSLGLSWHVSILDHIGQRPLWEQLDYSRPLDDIAADVRGISLSVYLCPSDGAPAVEELGSDRIASTSYLGNSGTGLFKAGFDGMFRHLAQWHHLYVDGPIRSADATDGLSNTAAVGEILHGIGFSPSRLRTVWNLPENYGPDRFQDFRSICLAIPSDPPAAGYGGSGIAHGYDWTHGSIGYSTYNHTLTPMNPSCFNGAHVPSGIFTSGSAHRGVVHLLYADGHVAAVAENVDQMVWEQFGSRNGSAIP